MTNPSGSWATVIRTAWDSDDDAAEFEAAATSAIGAAGGPAQVLPGESGATALDRHRQR